MTYRSKGSYRPPKYHNAKVKTEEGTFDSRREYARWMQLRWMERAGLIKDLDRQVKFLLIPTQREPDIIGPRGGRKPGKLLESECSYYADFVYTDTETGQKVVEDTKGVKTEAYMIKRKLMLKEYGIRIKEV